MRRALARAMNAHFFGVKRAFHATLRVARPALARIGLTPARFDLLYALARRGEGYQCSTLQSDLRRILGVTGATVCRMLQSLVALGLVSRTWSEHDRRQRNVDLTDEGRARVDAVCESAIESDLVTLAVDSALGGDRWFDWGHCLREKDDAESIFRRMRSAFGDRATLYYPWHPDD